MAALRIAMTALHGWSGLLFGWLLYFIFVTGTLGYFQIEIDRWMRPELPLADAATSVEKAAAIADTWLRAHAHGATSWAVELPTRRDPVRLTVSYTRTDGPWSGRIALDPSTGAALDRAVRDTGGGFALYRLHYELRYLPTRVAILIVGAATMLLAVGLVTGLIVHARIFRDFFTFRPCRERRSWLDAHNLLSVIILPFFLMITYSGLLFFMIDYMPAGAFSAYGRDGPKAYAADLYSSVNTAPTGQPAETAPLTMLVAASRAALGGGDIVRLDVRYPGDTGAVTIAYPDNETHIWQTGAHFLQFDAVHPVRPLSIDTIPSAPRAVLSAFKGLHEGLFANSLLRWLYFLCGLAGCGAIATGLHLWVAKRRARHASASTAPGLVEKGNASTILGLPIAIAAYFWANRLLPFGLEDRAAWEINSLFIAWGSCFLIAFLSPRHSVWVRLGGFAAAAYGLLPLLNLLTTNRHLGITLPAGDWALASFDLTAFAVSLGFLFLAIKAAAKGADPCGKPATKPRRSLAGA